MTQTCWAAPRDSPSPSARSGSLPAPASWSRLPAISSPCQASHASLLPTRSTSTPAARSKGCSERLVPVQSLKFATRIEIVLALFPLTLALSPKGGEGLQRPHSPTRFPEEPQLLLLSPDPGERMKVRGQASIALSLLMRSSL